PVSLNRGRRGCASLARPTASLLFEAVRATLPARVPRSLRWATHVILSVFGGLTWRGIRLQENNKIAERLGGPVVSLRFGNGLVCGAPLRRSPQAMARDSAPLGTLVTLDP